MVSFTALELVSEFFEIKIQKCNSIKILAPTNIDGFFGNHFKAG